MSYRFRLSRVGWCLLAVGLVAQRQSDAPSATVAARTSAARQPTDCSQTGGLARVVCLANAFKATLGQSQLTAVQLAYSKADAAKWSNFPEFGARPRRVGIRLGTLSAVQLRAAKALLAAAMAQDVANEGFDELEGNLAADDYLGRFTGKTGTFSSGNYFLAFLGAPSSTDLWELQFGGHHFAFANTYQDGNVTGATPSFRGVEPIAPVSMNGRTYQPMEQERQAFADMLGGLSSREQATAKLTSSFGDVLLGPGRDGQFPTRKQGLRVGDLSPQKQTRVLNAIKRYVNDLDPATATPVLTQYASELAGTYVAYSGSGTMSREGDYVRIDGPRVWIEYSAQPSRDIPGTPHPHSVWRDRTSDYGGN